MVYVNVEQDRRYGHMTDLKCYVHLHDLGYRWGRHNAYSVACSVNCILAIKLGHEVMSPSDAIDGLGLELNAATRRAYLKAINRIDVWEGTEEDIIMVRLLGVNIGVEVEVV